MRLPSLCLAVVFLACATAQAGPVEPGKEGALASFIAPQAGNRICYARTYSAEHLRKHPQQKVSEIGFRMAYYVHEPAADLPKGQRNYYFELTAKLRDRAKAATGSGECLPQGDAIACQIECDGGGIQVQRRSASDILVDFGTGAGGRIRLSESCDEEDAFDLEPGVDDRAFLLSRLPDADCPDYEDW